MFSFAWHSVQNNNATYPEYVDELRGIANGAKVNHVHPKTIFIFENITAISRMCLYSYTQLHFTP